MSFRFPLYTNGFLQSCTWLVMNSAATASRRSTYCSDPRILGACPISCGTSQYDDQSFMFAVTVGNMQRCNWIMADSQMVNNRRAMYCPTVGRMCPVSCGYFPFSNFVALPFSAPIMTFPVPNFPSAPSGPTGGKGKGSKGSRSSDTVNDRGNDVIPAPSPPTNPQIASAVTTSGSNSKNDVHSSIITVLTVLATFAWWLV